MAMSRCVGMCFEKQASIRNQSGCPQSRIVDSIRFAADPIASKIMMTLSQWIEDNSKQQRLWACKRLSGNDTLANGTHQAGPYLPKDLLFRVLPSLNRPESLNPETWLNIFIDSHDDPNPKRVRAIWYNGKLLGKGTRNEARLTNFGGAKSPLLAPENTASLVVFSFDLRPPTHLAQCRVWLCRTPAEEEQIEDIVGPVEPGRLVEWNAPGSDTTLTQIHPDSVCWLEPDSIPKEWYADFPNCQQVIDRALAVNAFASLDVDSRLLKRRDCEYRIFQSLEQAISLPRILRGFNSIPEFLSVANSISQRRKARSGRSLELHVRAILIEQGFRENLDFQLQPESEPGRKPDFLFPSEAHYKNLEYPAEKLRLLAVKTTCKDRWRQVCQEAQRIPKKHLLTLQEGVSENQFREMKETGIQLVVPIPLLNKFPKAIQPEIQTLNGFLNELKEL